MFGRGRRGGIARWPEVTADGVCGGFWHNLFALSGEYFGLNQGTRKMSHRIFVNILLFFYFEFRWGDFS